MGNIPSYFGLGESYGLDNIYLVKLLPYVKLDGPWMPLKSQVGSVAKVRIGKPIYYV